MSSTGLSREEVSHAIEAFMVTVKTSLARGENVYLRGFGSFNVTHRAAKTARNIHAKTTIVIPAHNVPDFLPCKEFKAMVREGRSVAAAPQDEADPLF